MCIIYHSQRQCQFLYQLEFVMENIHASSSIEIKQFCITILGLMFYVQQYRVPCFTLAFLSIKNHANYKSRRNMNFFGEIIEDLPADDEHNTVDFGNTLNKYKNHMLSQILILTSLYQTRELRRFHGHFVVDEYFINSSS